MNIFANIYYPKGEDRNEKETNLPNINPCYVISGFIN